MPRHYTFSRCLALFAGMTTGIACANAQSISQAFQEATCHAYSSGTSWAALACSNRGDYQALYGKDVTTDTFRQFGEVQDVSFVGKKAFSQYATAIWFDQGASGQPTAGIGTFKNFAVVVKLKNTCNQVNFVAGVLVEADLTLTSYSGNSTYFIPVSVHNEEVAAEKAAATLSSADAGETGPYPPDMSPSLTNGGPGLAPPAYVPGPNAPADHATRAAACYDAYRARCRDAFTRYKNALESARQNAFNGGVGGAAAGGAVGGVVGLIVFCVCPPAGAVVLTCVGVGAAAGGGVGAVGGSVYMYEETKRVAAATLKNDMTSALAEYVKCLESAGYQPWVLPLP